MIHNFKIIRSPITCASRELFPWVSEWHLPESFWVSFSVVEKWLLVWSISYVKPFFSEKSFQSMLQILGMRNQNTQKKGSRKGRRNKSSIDHSSSSHHSFWNSPGGLTPTQSNLHSWIAEQLCKYLSFIKNNNKSLLKSKLISCFSYNHGVAGAYGRCNIICVKR